MEPNIVFAIYKNEKSQKYIIGRKHIENFRKKINDLENISSCICCKKNDFELKIKKFFPKSNGVIFDTTVGQHDVNFIVKKEEEKKKFPTLKIYSKINVVQLKKNADKYVDIDKIYSFQSNIKFIIHNVANIEVSPLFTISNSILLGKPVCPYLVKLNEDGTIKERVVSKIKENTLFGKSYILFSDYRTASTFVASFNQNNFFIIDDFVNNKASMVSNVEIKNILFSNPEFHENKNIIWYSSLVEAEKSLNIINDNYKFLKNDLELLDIYVDGSCVPTKKMYSWSFVVYKNNKEIYFDKGHESQEKYLSHGAQVGEFLAMCHAMEYIIANETKNAIVWYDNTQNFNCMNHLNTSTNSDVFKKYFEYTLKMKQIMEKKGLNITYKHSKAHSGIIGNERADYLAKKAIYEVNSIF